MQYWLMKSEPSELSIDDLANLPNQTIEWFGVRKYQARNFMRDQMQIGDLALFWHSSCANPGIYGIVKVVTSPHADSSQFVVDNHYYDPRATMAKPMWWCVDVQFVNKTRYVAIDELRSYPELVQMRVLQKGNRLSITPLTHIEWHFLAEVLKRRSD